MSYPLSHTVDTTKKQNEKRKKNRNNLSKSVINGKQYKHQNTLAYNSQFMVKRLVS
jgi:hypothetical protein